MGETGTPKGILKYASRYKDGAWRNYSFTELAQWVELLTKRATHRTQFEKVIKDLDDAENYLAMLNSKLAECRQEILKNHPEYNEKA
jgi:hypothetical protein